MDHHALAIWVSIGVALLVAFAGVFFASVKDKDTDA